MGELTKQFDYRQIEDADLRSKLIYRAGEIRKRRDQIQSSVLEMGRELAEAQEDMANQRNGLFLAWVESECGFSKSSAYRMIGVHRVFGPITSQIGKLSDSAMYALSSDKCPEAATDEAVKLSKKGIYVTNALANQLIEKHTVSALPSPETEEVEEPEDPSPVISDEARELLRKAKITLKPDQEVELSGYDETSQVLLAASVAKGVQKLDEALATGHLPELWEELAVVHDRAIKALNLMRRELIAIADDENRGAYLLPVIVRIRGDIDAVKATIRQATPVGQRGKTIVTRADDERRS